MDDKTKFLALVSKGESCWLWNGRVNAKGYGWFMNRRANRIAWELFKGAITDGMHVLHKCDIPGCVNPDHLFLGTNNDNQKDMQAKGRARYSQPARSSEDRVIKAAIAFVLNEWSQAVEVKGSESMDYPVEFINLHDAVCALKGWEPQGEFPDDKDSKKD